MKTRITELLGIEYPVIQGAMVWVAFPQLVAAVSNAGGLGILGSAFMEYKLLRENIHQIKDRTDKPFAVNIVPESPDLPSLIEVIVEEKVPVVNYGLGNPKPIIDAAKVHGFIAMPTIGSVANAVRAERNGAHALVVTGMEGGGHVSRVATMVLLQLVLEKVKVPVVAGGGIGSARGMAAALAMGAEGISMGSRFIVTQESPVHENIKKFILQATEEDTVVTGHITGVRCRVIKNKLAEGFLELEERGAPKRELLAYGVGKMRLAFVEGDAEWGSVQCGQVCGMINDIPTCKELIERIVGGAGELLKSALALARA